MKHREHQFGVTAERYSGIIRRKGYALKIHWIDNVGNYGCVELYNLQGNFIGEYPTVYEAYKHVK